MGELAQKDFSHHMTQAEYFRYRKNWWISLNNSGRSGPLKKSFWLQRCVDNIKPSTPRIWRTTTQASAILEVSILAPIIEFFLQLVAMERFLVELINGSPHMSDVHSDMKEWWNLLFAVFGSNLRRSTFTIFLFFCSWIVYSWRRSTVTDEECKDNITQDFFRSVKLFKEFAYRSEIE